MLSSCKGKEVLDALQPVFIQIPSGAWQQTDFAHPALLLSAKSHWMATGIRCLEAKRVALLHTQHFGNGFCVDIMHSCFLRRGSNRASNSLYSSIAWKQLLCASQVCHITAGGSVQNILVLARSPCRSNGSQLALKTGRCISTSISSS